MQVVPLFRFQEKPHIVNKLPLLTPEQKEQVNQFFATHRNLENKVDWNLGANLTYDYFKKIMDANALYIQCITMYLPPPTPAPFRVCPGMALAHAEGVACLAALVRAYSMALACPAEDVKVGGCVGAWVRGCVGAWVRGCVGV